MPEKMYRTKKYIRLSYTDDKDNESNSVANQRSMLDTYIASQPDLVDSGEKVDDGYSGILFDRPAFQELMEEIKAGEIDCIVVKDLSRFGREFVETGRYLRRVLPAYGVRFIAVNDHIDTANGSSGDDIQVSFQSVINDAYCRDISIKTRSALDAKRSNGEYVGAFAMYGYRKAEGNKNRLVVDEYPASIVRDIFRMRIEGMSAAAIAQELNRRGVLCPLAYRKEQGLPHAKRGFADKADIKWAPIAVIRILRDETYTGTLVQNRKGTPNYKIKDIVERPKDDWIVIENAHTPIVSRYDYEVVQRLARLDTRAAPGETIAPVFSGLLVCNCGTQMTRKTVPVNGKTYHYYYCPAGKKNGCDTPVMLREEKLVACVLSNIKAHVSDLLSHDKLLAVAAERQRNSDTEKLYRGQIAENHYALERAQKLRNSLYQALMDGQITKDEYRDFKADYTGTIQEKQATIETLEQELEQHLTGGDELSQRLERLRIFSSLTTLDRKTAVQCLHHIEVCEKGLLEIQFAYQIDWPEFGPKLDKEVA